MLKGSAKESLSYLMEEGIIAAETWLVDVKFYKVTGALNVGQGHQVIVNGVREC